MGCAVDISVVVCTWNNCERLRSTLEAFAKCPATDGFTWELLVVANNCSDRTAEVADGFARQLPLIYVEEPIQGLSHARNRGLATARGELIVFADDDIEPCADWLALYWAAYRENRPGAHLFGGPIVSKYEGDPPPPEMASHAPASVVGYDLDQPRGATQEYFLSANWACPAEALRQVGGFDTRLGISGDAAVTISGEETDLQRRLRDTGLTPFYIPDACVRHWVPREKCALAHIAGRSEGNGYYRGYLRATAPASWFRSRIETPVRLLGKMALAGISYLGSVLMRGDRVTRYLRWRTAVGLFRGYRAALRRTPREGSVR